MLAGPKTPDSEIGPGYRGNVMKHCSGFDKVPAGFVSGLGSKTPCPFTHEASKPREQRERVFLLLPPT